MPEKLETRIRNQAARRGASTGWLEGEQHANTTRAATRRLLQSVSNQFPCNVTLFRNGLSPIPLCPQCIRRNPQSQQRESFGHIQCWCPTLAKPRTAAHLSIWRELLASIKINSNITRAPLPAQSSDSITEDRPTAAPRPAKLPNGNSPRLSEYDGQGMDHQRLIDKMVWEAGPPDGLDWQHLPASRISFP